MDNEPIEIESEYDNTRKVNLNESINKQLKFITTDSYIDSYLLISVVSD